MAKFVLKLQIGKKGLTKEFVEQVRRIFENVHIVKISILKSCCRGREEAEKIGKELIQGLGVNYTYNLIGYVLTVRKWRKPQR